jgi:hypothetical protein
MLRLAADDNFNNAIVRGVLLRMAPWTWSASKLQVSPELMTRQYWNGPPEKTRDTSMSKSQLACGPKDKADAWRKACTAGR